MIIDVAGSTAGAMQSAATTRPGMARIDEEAP
jgi:hypothetical protein